VWRPKSSSASSTASSSFLQQPPPSASSSSDGTPKSNGEGSATGAEIEAPTGKKRVRDDECDGNDIGERVKLNGVTATEVQGAKGGEVEPKGKQQRSRKRNKVTKRNRLFYSFFVISILHYNCLDCMLSFAFHPTDDANSRRCGKAPVLSASYECRSTDGRRNRDIFRVSRGWNRIHGKCCWKCICLC